MMQFSFATTARIECAHGASGRLGEICRDAGAKRVFVVSDAGVEQAGLLAAPAASIAAAGMGCKVWTSVVADPPQADVEAAVAAAIDFNADMIVGIGGGSPMDTAKLVALLCGRRQRLDDIYGIGLAQGPRLRLIQVPTTAGTGSEVTPIAIVTTPDSEKKGVVSPLLYPDLALLDAELTKDLPPSVTATTGVDAMVHAIEAYTSRHKKNPISDALATGALRLLSENIDEAVSGQASLPAREAMLLGACMAGMAFANAPVAAVHALAYPLGGHFHVPHGLSNALVLCEVLRFNRSAATRAYAELAGCVASDPPTDERKRCDFFIARMAALVARMPMPQRLSDVGVTENDLDRLAVIGHGHGQLGTVGRKPTVGIGTAEHQTIAIVQRGWLRLLIDSVQLLCFFVIDDESVSRADESSATVLGDIDGPCSPAPREWIAVDDKRDRRLFALAAAGVPSAQVLTVAPRGQEVLSVGMTGPGTISVACRQVPGRALVTPQFPSRGRVPANHPSTQRDQCAAVGGKKELHHSVGRSEPFAAESGQRSGGQRVTRLIHTRFGGVLRPGNSGLR